MPPGPGRSAAFLVCALLLGLPGSARAQEEDPLLDLAGLQRATTRESLDGAAAARNTCASLVDVVNDVARQWERVRRGELDRDAWQPLVGDARRVWNDQWLACSNAHNALEFESPAWSMLGWERKLVGAIWEALMSVSKAWLEDSAPERLQTAANAYLGRLAIYGRWLDGAADYWEGRWLLQGPRGCLDDAVDSAARLGKELRAQMILPASRRDPAALPGLTSTRVGMLRALEACRRDEDLTPVQRVELALLEERLGAYGAAVAALESGDMEALDAAMKTEQAVTERLVRCQTEHADARVSPACEAPGTP